MLTKSLIEKYFVAEKNACLVFIIIGIITTLVAIAGYLVYKNNFWKGAFIPLLLLGTVQIITAYMPYKKADEFRTANVYAMDMNPSLLKEKELPRMQQLQRSINLFRWIEIALIVVAAVLIFRFRADPEQVYWYGFGVALLVQSAILLVGEIMAGQRASGYLLQLDAFIKQIG